MARESIEDRRARLMPGAVWIRSEREKRGMTQRELARQLDTDQTRLSAYERAQDEPPPDVARKLAQVFGLTELEVWTHLEKPLPHDLRLQAMTDDEVIAYVRRHHPGVLEQILSEATGGGKDEPSDVRPRPRRGRPKKITRPDEPGQSASRG